MSQFMFAWKVFAIIYALLGVGVFGSAAIGRALPYSGPVASTAAVPWSAL